MAKRKTAPSNKKSSRVQSDDPEMARTSLEGMVEDLGADEAKDLATLPATSANPAAALAGFSDDPDFGVDDTYIPRLRLGQALSREVSDGNARAGQWLLTGHDPVDKVSLVPLAFARKRELRGEEDRQILCSSDDGVTGVGEPGGRCEVCPLSQWSGPDSKRVAPPCNFFYSYVCYAVEFDSVVMINFAKTALSTGKTMNTIVQQNGMRRCIVELGSGKVESKRGTYYKPTVAGRGLTPEIVDAMKASSNPLASGTTPALPG